MPTWRDDKILELANQLTYSPADKRREQMNSAIALLPQIDPAKNYPWDFIQFRITGIQPRAHSERALPGKLLRADLASLVEFLSDTLAIKIEEVQATGDAVMEMDAVSRKFNVSSKTIQRWRKQGLIALKYIHPDGRRRLGFLESAVKEFADTNKDKVDKSAAFKQLSDEERRQIITLARQHAATHDASIKELSQLIARELGRAPETVRYTIRNYDREHPEAAIFDADGQLAPPPQSPRVPNHNVQQGTLFDEPSAAEAGQNTSRTARLRALKIEWIPNPLFDHPDADNIILHVLPAEALARAQASVAAGTNSKGGDVYMAHIPGGLPGYLSDIFNQPIMPLELEIDAFRQMNYLKVRAAKLQAGIGESEPPKEQLDAMENLLNRAAELKNTLLQNNLRVAIHVARKHQRPDRTLLELVSDATIWLMRAIEKFDFARNTRFTTYAGYAIMKNFARDRAEQITRRDRHMVTGQEDILNALGARPEEVTPEQIDAATMKNDLRSLINELPERERKLVASHYGLDAGDARSLAQIGDEMGITKARVRQLEARALRRLRQLLEARRGNSARSRGDIDHQLSAQLPSSASACAAPPALPSLLSDDAPPHVPP